MPVEYTLDPAAALVVVTVSDHPPLLELGWHVERLLADPVLSPAVGVLVIAHANHRPPPPWEMPGMIRLLARLRESFGGRLAVVTASVGVVTTAHLLTLAAGAGDLFRAFTDDDAARRWVLEGVR